jgi:hypothetical protein
MNKPLMNYQTKIAVAMFAIVVALALVGAVAIQSIIIPQQAFADKPSGCSKKSTGFESSEETAVILVIAESRIVKAVSNI